MTCQTTQIALLKVGQVKLLVKMAAQANALAEAEAVAQEHETAVTVNRARCANHGSKEDRGTR